VKGQGLAAWNVHANKEIILSYTMANRGACHMNGGNVEGQNTNTMHDAMGICRFVTRGFGGNEQIVKFMNAILGTEYTVADYLKIGERIYNLERNFNCREGFTAADDVLPERFYTEPLTVGEHAGAIVTREEAQKTIRDYYVARGWDASSGVPTKTKLEELSL